MRRVYVIGLNELNYSSIFLTHILVYLNISYLLWKRIYRQRTEKAKGSFNELFVNLLYSFSNHLHKDSISDEAPYPLLGLSVYDE